MEFDFIAVNTSAYSFVSCSRVSIEWLGFNWAKQNCFNLYFNLISLLQCYSSILNELLQRGSSR